jgi:tetratricopeptide (TPR) repeat protein
MTHRLQGDYGGARAYSEQAMAIFQDIGDLPGLTINLDNVGAIALAQGDLEAAQTYHNRALELARQLRDPEGEATSLCNLGLLYIQMGQYAQAGECLAAALQQFRQMGHRRGEADALHNLGVLEVRREQAAVATKLLGQSLVIRQEIGELDNALVTKAWLGLAALTAGDVERSRAYVGEVVLHLESEAYGGDAPQQEIWWTAYRVWQAAGQRDAAHRALEQAHALIQEQAGRIEDPTLRRSFLERVPVNREVEEAWRETR